MASILGFTLHVLMQLTAEFTARSQPEDLLISPTQHYVHAYMGLGGLLALSDNFSSSRAQVDSTVGAIDIFDVGFSSQSFTL